MSELRRARAQSERLGLRSAKDRVLHYLETEGQSGRVRLAQSKKAWASELGLSHEALYRTLSEMQKSGQIAVDGRSVLIGSADNAVAAQTPKLTKRNSTHRA